MIIMFLLSGTFPSTRQPVILSTNWPSQYANSLHFGAGWSVFIVILFPSLVASCISRNLTEHRTRSQTGTAWVVKIEQATDKLTSGVEP